MAKVGVEPNETVPMTATAGSWLDQQAAAGSLLNKGSVSNAATFIVMVFFILAKWQTDSNSLAIDYGLAFGLFGFAGGITNWLAVKMLFDRVPGLLGSGVIPRHFQEIRLSVKSMCFAMFFEEEKIKSYLSTHSGDVVSTMIQSALDRPDLDEQLLKSLTVLADKPEGQMIKMFAPMMGGIPGLVPKLKPMLLSFAGDVVGNVDLGEVVPVAAISAELEKFMDQGLLLLTPDTVKRMMEGVIRQHLGWLVVWGNVFGGLIGVICLAAGLKLGHN